MYLGVGKVETIGTFYRVTLTGTSNTATTIRPCVFVNSSSVYIGDGTGGFYLGQMSLEQAAFPSSYISNRNLLLQTGPMNTSWTQTDTTPTLNSIADPITGLTTVTLFTEGSAGTAQVTQTSGTVVASQSFTGSVHLKLGNQGWLCVAVSNGAATNAFRQWVNVSTLALGSHSNRHGHCT